MLLWSNSDFEWAHVDMKLAVKQMVNILINHIYFGEIFYLCGTNTKFYHHLGNKNAGFLNVLLVGP